MSAQYDKQAADFLTKTGLRIRKTQKADRCPPWDTDNRCIHGDRYIVTVTRPGSGSIRFDFWNSLADVQEGRTLSDHSVLAALSSDAHMPTDPDELIAELGPMPIKQALAASRFATKLQDFFTNTELHELGEIR